MNNNTTLTIDLFHFQRYAEGRLRYIADQMPGGRFWNTHGNGYADTCEGIALTARGEVVCLKLKTAGCSINELKEYARGQEHVENGETFEVYLCSSSCGAVFHTRKNMDEAVREYNDSLTSPGSTIVAYRLF